MKRTSSLLIAASIAGMSSCSENSNVMGPSGDPEWTRTSSGLPGDATCLALTASGTTFLTGTDGDGVFRSTDGGLNWTAATTQPTNLRINSLTASGTTLLAGTFGDGVFRSTDGGDTGTKDTTQPTDGRSLSLTAGSTALFTGTSHSGVWRYPL